MELTTVYDRPVAMTVTDSWDPMEIREMCITHDWYNAGTCRDYDNLLEIVQRMAPTPVNIMRVAQDIVNHTRDVEDAELINVMFVIANDIVMRTFEF